MQRLELLDESGGPFLAQLPQVPWAACELIACTAAAAAYAGRAVAYSDLLCSSGAAFMLAVSQDGFRHWDALANRWRFLQASLVEAGFGRALVCTEGVDFTGVAGEELMAGRPLVVAGCFPEAPWRAGLVVALPAENRWAVMDTGGRVHCLAPRGKVVVATREPNQPSRAYPLHVLERCLWCWEGVEENEGASGWQKWLEHLESEPPRNQAEARSQVAAHEWLYETVLEGRSYAATWLHDLALQTDGLASDWLMEGADILAEMVGLMESRDPPLHQPEVLSCFMEPSWRTYLADIMA
ncbi:MAG: hypothetical protein N2512_02655, partial [Armatimonadetes bacterium]|nr:hypothetical protein [Armatimonadota bacterium]